MGVCPTDVLGDIMWWLTSCDTAGKNYSAWRMLSRRPTLVYMIRYIIVSSTMVKTRPPDASSAIS